MLYEVITDAGHMLFMGGLWYALTIIGLGMTYCILKALIDTCGCEGGSDHHH